MRFKLIFLFTIILCKNSNGQTIQWQNTIGGSAAEFIYDAQPTADKGFILGGSSASNISSDKSENSRGEMDYWIVKVDSNGIVQWNKTLGGDTLDELRSIGQTADGGYIIAGFTGSKLSGDKTEGSQGNFDMWIIKVNSIGIIQWQNTIGGSSDDRANVIKQTPDGGYIIGGHSSSNISGDKTANSKGFVDYWIIKLNSTGTIVWQKTIGGSNTDWLTSMDLTSDGGFILAGYSFSPLSGDKTEANTGSINMWIVKTDSLGNIQWQNTIGGTSFDFPTSINRTLDGGYIVGGYSSSMISGDKTENSYGNTDYWLVKLSDLGAIQWQKDIGGSIEDVSYSVACTADSGYIVGGHSKSGISGNKTDGILGSEDYWIVRLNSTGNILWQNDIGGNLHDVCTTVKQLPSGRIFISGYSSTGINGDKTESGKGSWDIWILNLDDSTIPCNTPPVSVTSSVSNDTIALGNSVTLTQNGGALAAGGSYKWYTSSCGGTLAGTGPSITVTPIATTTYYVRAEAPCGYTTCVSKKITVVSVPPDLGVTAMVSPTTGLSCYGLQTIVATIKNFGNTVINFSTTPASVKCQITGTSTATFSFNPTGTLAAGTTLNVTFTPAFNMAVSGPYNFSVYTVMSADINFSNDTLPLQTITGGITTGTISAQVSSYCAQGSPTLIYSNSQQSIQWEKATSPGGTWTSATTSVNDTVIPGVITQTTYYRVKITCGASNSYSNVISVVINPLPTPITLWLSPSEACIYNSPTLNFWYTPVPGEMYQWLLYGQNIIGATNYFYFPSSSGSYSIVKTNSNGCSSTSNAVSVWPAPYNYIIPSGPVSLCPGNSMQLNLSSSYDSLYQWRLNSQPIPGATGSNYTASTPGNYSVIVTSSHGCIFQTSDMTITQSTAPPIATISPSGTVSVCTPNKYLQGSTGGGYSYQWKLNSVDIPGATSSFYIASASGSYTVVCSTLCGTSTSPPTTLIMNTVPTASIAAGGPTTFCSGGSVSLNANAGSGLTYQWVLNGSNISGQTGASYTTGVAGSYTVKVTNNCGTATASPVVVVVNPAPSASITAGGPTTFCSGGNVALNANTGSGFTYIWKKNSSVISGAVNASYTATASGNYVVLVTNSCGTATSPPASVTVNSLPSAAITPGGATTFCSGGNVILSAPFNVGHSYQWKKSGVNVSGATSSSYIAAATGNYKVTVTNTLTGCSKTTPSAITVTVNPKPTATVTPQGPTSFCAGDSVVLIANAGTGFSYGWRKNNNLISGATNISYTAKTAGAYKVMVTTINGCTKFSSVVNVAVPCREAQAGVMGEPEISVYPSPSSGNITIDLYDMPAGEMQMTLVDMFGKTLSMQMISEWPAKMDFTFLSPGVYTLQFVTTDGKMFRRNFVVAK